MAQDLSKKESGTETNPVKLKKACKPGTASKATGPWVYVGPNLGGDLLITQFSTFKNKLPLHIEQKAAADQDFKRLFVPVAELASARKRIGQPGSALARAFKSVLQGQSQKRENN